MASGNREHNIRRVIEMEDRICQCNRCPSLVKCIRKPSMGKGELEPQGIMIFEYDNAFTRDINKVIALRNLVKEELGMDKVYHTFLVRCQPKACACRQSLNCYTDNKWITRNQVCMLSGKDCEGIPVKPGTDEIISCLPFLLEEIVILNPQYIILFGSRVAEFVLRAYGIYDNIQLEQSYTYEQMKFITTVGESEFQADNCREILNIL